MKLKTSAFTLLAAAALGTTFLLAEDKPDSKAAGPKAEEMKQKMEVAGKPGAAHKALEPLVGEWTAEVHCWSAPGGSRMVTTGTATTKWVLDGRFLHEDFTAEFFGKPLHGMSLMGYDNTKKMFTSVWVDDMSTAIITSEGQAAEDSKIITLEGKFHCPETGRKDTPMKQVFRIISNDKHIFEMHDMSKGENSKTMELTYTRK